MGLSLLAATIQEGIYKAPEPSQAMKDTYHFRDLLRRFAGHVILGEKLTQREEEHLEKLGINCANFLQMKAYDCYSYELVMSILTDILRKSVMPPVGVELLYSL